MIILSQFSRPNPNVVYETGITEEGILLVKKGKDKYILAHPLVKGSVEKATNIEVVEFSKSKFIREIKGEVVGTDFSNSTKKFLDLLAKHAKSLRDVSKSYELRRARKSRREVSVMRKASRIAEEALLNMEGETEESAKWSIVKNMAEMKAYEAFPTIVANKTNSRFPHHIPTREILDGHILVDRGARYENYCSDLTDVINLKGRPASIYEELKDIFYTIVDALPSFEKASEVHDLYLSLYKKKKMRPMPHLIGHGVGIEVHEHPKLYKDVDFPLEKTVLALEPSYYGRSFGLRFERMVYVRGRKAEIL